MRAPRPALLALLAILAGGLAVRLMSLRHGLPWSYHADEASHFASRAAAMFGGNFDPGYFENPSAYTYLVHAALRVMEGGPGGPGAAFETGRIVAIALCMLGVVAVFEAGRRLWGPAEGVAAAAVLAFAFLPVAYSRFALTDTGVLAPVAVALYGAVRASEDGRLRWFLLAGGALGLAVAFKYMAGLAGIPLLAAAALRGRRGRGGALAGVALATLLGAAVFALTNPFFVLHLDEALTQLGNQRDAAAVAKLGQGDRSGPSYYLGSLTWGLGWGAALAAAAGVAWEWRRNRGRALLLALFPLVLFLYLCTAGRFFARWLLPAYPVLALLAGIALAGVAARVPGAPWRRGGVLALLLLAVLAQPIAADVRTGRLLNRTDTRMLARDFVLAELPHKARVVVEPAAPSGFFLERVVKGFGPPPRALVSGGKPQRFIRALEPARLGLYREAGYCVVVTASAVRGRAEIDGVRPALAYYRALERQSDVIFRASPYAPGAEPPPFDFDQSTHLYYPRAYRRPGPEVRVHRLRDCAQGTGGPGAQAPPPRRALRRGLRAAAAG